MVLSGSERLQPSETFCTLFVIGQTPKVNPDGLKRLTQTHSLPPVLLLYCVAMPLTHSSGAHALKNDFLPVGDEGDF